MTIVSAANLIDALRQHQLVEAKQLAELPEPLQSSPEPKPLLKELVRRGWLTLFQANQLLNGRAGDLLVAQYVLLERLGEGATGQVFKARHQKMKRLAALKIIRRELLANAEAVERFYREVHATSRLHHPNIVEAYDAGPTGATHFLAMQYVEGTDLARRVAKEGPLAPAQACAYITQVAHGLQHAFECGLVHRDIKPSNLIVTTREDQVKILDLGLVQVNRAACDGRAAGALTENGSFIGTVDFIAPEQAENPRAVDIRADIYSLGCTLYYLLGGRPPLPEGTLFQKLLKLQQAEPTPIEALRPEVSAPLAAVVRTMMAKCAEDRYQTPAEAAEALAALAATESAIRGGQREAISAALPRHDRSGPPPKTVEALADETLVADSIERPPRAGLKKRWLWVSGASGLIAAVLVVGSLWLAKRPVHEIDSAVGPRAPTQPATRPDPELTRPSPFEQWLASVKEVPPDAQAKAVIRKLQELNPGFDGKATFKVVGKAVTDFSFQTDHVADLAPLRALTGLKRLTCYGSKRGLGRVTDLTPLEGFALTDLRCQNNDKIADLAPLRGCPLTALDCGNTQVTSLEPLRGKKLTWLSCTNTKVADLTPLRDMPLSALSCIGIRIVNLKALRGLPLVSLDCGRTQVADLTPLLGMKLVDLRFGETKVTDLRPLEDLPLKRLVFGKTQVTDLTPLKGMKLTRLDCSDTPVSDLSPVGDMALAYLNCRGSKVNDLTVVRGMPLTDIICSFQAKRDGPVLRALKKLERINYKPAAEFWKEVEAKERKE
jgi:serine/threonine protein kinase